MISPVLLLSVINVFVFGLPVVSGERISYAMTSFLSLAVYMTIIAEELPDGNPVPIFTCFIIGKLVYSSLIILCTIIGLQLHHGKESELIRNAKTICAKFRRLPCSIPNNCSTKLVNSIRAKKRRKVANTETVDISPMGNEKKSTSFPDNIPENTKTPTDKETKWKRTAKIFDRVCLLVFLLIVVWVVLTWFA